MNTGRILGLLSAVLSIGPVASASQDPFTVTTTIGMITDIVSQVAGNRVKVQGIMKEGIDPHLYRPTRNDVVKLMKADVVFYNGLMLEERWATS